MACVSLYREPIAGSLTVHKRCDLYSESAPEHLPSTENIVLFYANFRTEHTFLKTKDGPMYTTVVWVYFKNNIEKRI